MLGIRQSLYEIDMKCFEGVEKEVCDENGN